MIIDDLEHLNDIKGISEPDLPPVLGGGYYGYQSPTLNLWARVKAYPNGLETQTEAEVVAGYIADLRVDQRGTVLSGSTVRSGFYGSGLAFFR